MLMLERRRGSQVRTGSHHHGPGVRAGPGD